MTRLAMCVVAFLILLSGCYESSSDLIGGNANNVQVFDSLIVKGGEAYVATPRGTSTTLCKLSLRADLTKPCTEGTELKLERTQLGNYIVQAKNVLSSYNYGIWFRSERTPFSRDAACFLWIGDGVVGGGAFPRAVEVAYGQTPAFQAFAKELRDIAATPQIDRAKLLKIVAAYEFKFQVLPENWPCIDERPRIDGSHVAIEGDIRHLKPFESNSKP